MVWGLLWVSPLNQWRDKIQRVYQSSCCWSQSWDVMVSRSLHVVPPGPGVWAEAAALGLGKDGCFQPNEQSSAWATRGTLLWVFTWEGMSLSWVFSKYSTAAKQGCLDSEKQSSHHVHLPQTLALGMSSDRHLETGIKYTWLVWSCQVAQKQFCLCPLRNLFLLTSWVQLVRQVTLQPSQVSRGKWLSSLYCNASPYVFGPFFLSETVQL